MDLKLKLRLKPLAARALILVGGGNDNSVEPAGHGGNALVGTGMRMVPTVYEELRNRRRRGRLAMILWLTIPTLIAAFYYGLIASKRYVSDMQMVLSNQTTSIGSLMGASGGGGSSLLSLLGSGGDQSNEHAIVANYLASSDAMNAVDQSIGLRKMWSAGTIDHWSRMSASASQEDFLKYYRSHITVVSDPTDPVVEVKVEAFTPADAQLIGGTLVKVAQAKLESTFGNMRQDALKFGQEQVRQAETQLSKANEDLRVFRDDHADLDPAASAKGVGTVTAALFGQLTSAETELRTALTYARPDSSLVKSIKSRIDALKSQINADRELMAGNPANKPYSSSMSNYEDLLLKQKFAQDSYASAMSFLAARRADLEHQHVYLVDYLAPTLPQEATEPRTTRNVTLVFIACILIWLTQSFLVSALREHGRR